MYISFAESKIRLKLTMSLLLKVEAQSCFKRQTIPRLFVISKFSSLFQIEVSLLF